MNQCFYHAVYCEFLNNQNTIVDAFWIVYPNYPTCSESDLKKGYPCNFMTGIASRYHYQPDAITNPMCSQICQQEIDIDCGTNIRSFTFQITPDYSYEFHNNYLVGLRTICSKCFDQQTCENLNFQSILPLRFFHIDDNPTTNKFGCFFYYFCLCQQNKCKLKWNQIRLNWEYDFCENTWKCPGYYKYTKTKGYLKCDFCVPPLRCGQYHGEIAESRCDDSRNYFKNIFDYCVCDVCVWVWDDNSKTWVNNKSCSHSKRYECVCPVPDHVGQYHGQIITNNCSRKSNLSNSPTEIRFCEWVWSNEDAIWINSIGCPIGFICESPNEFGQFTGEVRYTNCFKSGCEFHKCSYMWDNDARVWVLFDKCPNDCFCIAPNSCGSRHYEIFESSCTASGNNLTILCPKDPTLDPDCKKRDGYKKGYYRDVSYLDNWETYFNFEPNHPTINLKLCKYANNNNNECSFFWNPSKKSWEILHIGCASSSQCACDLPKAYFCYDNNQFSDTIPYNCNNYELIYCNCGSDPVVKSTQCIAEDEYDLYMQINPGFNLCDSDANCGQRRIRIKWDDCIGCWEAFNYYPSSCYPVWPAWPGQFHGETIWTALYEYPVGNRCYTPCNEGSCIFKFNEYNLQWELKENNCRECCECIIPNDSPSDILLDIIRITGCKKVGN